MSPERYARNMAANVAKVHATACIAMPGYLDSRSADSPPSASPSSAAYTGAVTGDHSFLKMVTMAAMNPPITPSAIHGPATEGSKAGRTWDHTQAAGTTTKNSRNAALFTVPSSVIAGVVGSRCTPANAFALRTGLEVRIRAMFRLSLESGATPQCNIPESLPTPQAPDVVMHHEELLEHRHALALALELHPLGVRHAVRLAYLAEGAPEPAGQRQRPMVVQVGVPELVQDQPGEHVPRDLVAPSFPRHVAPLDLDDLGRAVRHARDAGAQQHAVAPGLDARHDEQLAHPAQRLADQVAPRRVLAAPGADVHPVVHPPVAVRADVLEPVAIAPLLRPAAPRAVAHRVHHSTPASPATTAVVLESLGRLERLRARVAVADLASAPGTVCEAVRHHPAAIVALGPRLLRGVAPLESTTAVRAERPEALELGRARRAAQLRGRHFPSTPSHAPAPRPRSAR